MQYTLQQLKDQLDILIARSEAGEEIIITRDGQPVVRIMPERTAARKHNRPPAGSAKGTIKYMDPDFDAPLDDFKEYME